MMNRSRREFLADVGKGMLIASVGPALAADLGLASALAAEGPETLSFGRPRAAGGAHAGDARRQTAADPRGEAAKPGPTCDALVAAAALANARTFGGQDYDGYHAFMALVPAYHMAKELPERPGGPARAQGALPQHRPHAGMRRPQERGAAPRRGRGTAQGPAPAAKSCARPPASPTWTAAERTFAALAHGPVGDAYNDLQFCIQDEVDVHRVVLAWRAWAMLDLTGKEQAHTLLRQSVRYCVRRERTQRRQAARCAPCCRSCSISTNCWAGRSATARPRTPGSSSWRDDLRRQPATGRRSRGRGPGRGDVAGGRRRGDLAGGESAGAVRSRPPQGQASRGKPEGSVHGDSVGVHASDSANAWRNIARVSNPRNTVASLIVGAFHTAGQTGGLNKEPQPLPEQLEKITAKDADALLRDAEAADQGEGPGPRLRPGASLRRTGPSGAAGLRPAAEATPSARTAPCTRRSITAPSARSSRPRGRRSAGGSWWPWPASRPASTASRRRATRRRAGC